MDPHPLKDYLASLEASLKRGDATEHTHRPALKALLEAVVSDPAVQAVNEPRRGEVARWMGRSRPSLRHDQVEQLLRFGGIERFQVLVDR